MYIDKFIAKLCDRVECTAFIVECCQG